MRFGQGGVETRPTACFLEELLWSDGKRTLQILLDLASISTSQKDKHLLRAL